MSASTGLALSLLEQQRRKKLVEQQQQLRERQRRIQQVQRQPSSTNDVAFVGSWERNLPRTGKVVKK